MDKISLQGKCSIRNIQGQMVRISLQEEKQLYSTIYIYIYMSCKFLHWPLPMDGAPI